MRAAKWTIQIGVLESDNGWSRERQKYQLRIKLKHYGSVRVRLERRIEEKLDADSLGNPIG